MQFERGAGRMDGRYWSEIGVNLLVWLLGNAYRWVNFLGALSDFKPAFNATGMLHENQAVVGVSEQSLEK